MVLARMIESEAKSEIATLVNIKPQHFDDDHPSFNVNVSDRHPTNNHFGQLTGFVAHITFVREQCVRQSFDTLIALSTAFLPSIITHRKDASQSVAWNDCQHCSRRNRRHVLSNLDFLSTSQVILSVPFRASIRLQAALVIRVLPLPRPENGLSLTISHPEAIAVAFPRKPTKLTALSKSEFGPSSIIV
jgi:hypothetical protein